MAKKKKKSSKKGGDAAWKHSPVVGIVLVLLIVGCILYTLSALGGGGGGSLLPDNFPHAYLAAADDGKYEAVLVKPGKNETKVPFAENGKEYWQAFVCMNENCPGRQQAKTASASKTKKKTKKEGDAPAGKPYIFAYVEKPMANPPAESVPEGAEGEAPVMLEPPQCPKCREAYKKASAKRKVLYEMSSAERYYTPEGMKILDLIRDDLRKKYQ